MPDEAVPPEDQSLEELYDWGIVGSARAAQARLRSAIASLHFENPNADAASYWDWLRRAITARYADGRLTPDWVRSVLEAHPSLRPHYDRPPDQPQPMLPGTVYVVSNPVSIGTFPTRPEHAVVGWQVGTYTTTQNPDDPDGWPQVYRTEIQAERERLDAAEAALEACCRVPDVEATPLEPPVVRSTWHIHLDEIDENLSLVPDLDLD